ncbi:MAG: prepilin-type N-terminal cleavage/methylation domain-containing protein [Thermosynechococcaceae cyanobacterium]
MSQTRKNVQHPNGRSFAYPSWNCNSDQGFTLTELLIASAIMSVVVAIAFGGLLSMIQANDTAKDQIIRRSELDRALDFMADDIREATSISYTKPPGWTEAASTNYQPLFYLVKPPLPDGTQPTVAYYVRLAKGVVWQKPWVLYRLEPSNADLNSKTFQDVGNRGDPLVDAIIGTAPACKPLPGTSTAGLLDVGARIFIAQNQTAKVCLAGKLGETNSVSLETQVFTRGHP